MVYLSSCWSWWKLANGWKSSLGCQSLDICWAEADRDWNLEAFLAIGIGICPWEMAHVFFQLRGMARPSLEITVFLYRTGLVWNRCQAAPVKRHARISYNMGGLPCRAYSGSRKRSWNRWACARCSELAEQLGRGDISHDIPWHTLPYIILYNHHPFL